MDVLEEWEKLEIDDSDIFGAFELHSSRPPPPASILPSKRPLPSQLFPTTDGILNRFKKQNSTQNLKNPILSIPPDFPPPRNTIRRPHEHHGLENPRILQESQPPQRPNPPPRDCSPSNENHEAAAEGEVRIKYVSIPGPAGAVQRVLHKKVEADGRGVGDDRTRGIGSRSISRQEDDDFDFKEAAWLSAIDYLHRKSLGCSEAKFSVKPTISFIKKRGNIDRIPQILGIIKTCTPNKLGSMLVTLKDPTGTIGCSINHRVMTDSEFGRDISVGAVLLLRQVVVFSPTPWAHYLNININNIEKVFKKGNCLPERQDGASTSKNGNSIPSDMFKEAGSMRLSADRASQQDCVFSSKNNEATTHILHSRLIDKNVTATQNAGFHQHHHLTTDNNLEGRKASPQEDNNQQRFTHEIITPAKIPSSKDNILKVMSSEQDPHTRTNCPLENVKMCCNKKESIPVTIDWNGEVELLLADEFDLFN